MQLDSIDEQAAAIRRELDGRIQKCHDMERVSLFLSSLADVRPFTLPSLISFPCHLVGRASPAEPEAAAQVRPEGDGVHVSGGTALLRRHTDGEPGESASREGDRGSSWLPEAEAIQSQVSQVSRVAASSFCPSCEWQ